MSDKSLSIYDQNLIEMKNFMNSFKRFMLYYKFGMDELNTKISILRQEFEYVHDYNPIEHVKSRIKSAESVMKKVRRKGLEVKLDTIRENVRDIAGIRITCSFVSDIYSIAAMIVQQQDVEVVEFKDYIKNPKPNGYQSLHMICSIPVFMSDRMENVYVEVQIRTIAMDFWASLEHKIYYKHENSGEVPQKLRDELKEAAQEIAKLDLKMENIHEKIRYIKGNKIS